MQRRAIPTAGSVVTGLLLILAGCGDSKPVVFAPSKPPVAPRNEIDPSKLGEVMTLTREGLGLMEQYRYAEAAERFRKVCALAPGWHSGSINLAIALLNDTGVKAENSKKSAGAGAAVSSNFAEALSLLDAVIEAEPKNLHARFCRGIILKYLSGDPEHPDNIVRAHRDFQVVVDEDPSDGHAWYKLGDSLFDPESLHSEFGPRPAGPRQAKRLVELYSKAMERNPYLVANLYQLQQAYSWAGEVEKQKSVLDLFRKFNPQGDAAAPGDIVGNFYGDMGKYAQIINPFVAASNPGSASTPPRFATTTPIDVKLAEGDRWARSSDFTGPLAPIGRFRARFGAAVASLDADKDGKLDLFLAASVFGPKGLRDALLLNKGGGRFEDVTLAAGLDPTRASLSVAAADFDADLHTDLFLTGLNGNRLLRCSGKGKFTDVTKAAGVGGIGFVSIAARWLDLDQDGDLDLYVVNYCRSADAGSAFGESPPAGSTNLAFRNDGRPAPIASRPVDNYAPVAVATDDLKATEGLSIVFSPWGESSGLPASASNFSGIAALDVDDDRDVDLVLAADDKPPVMLLNQRLGVFKAVEMRSLKIAGRVSGLAATDLDKDGRVDLVAPSSAGRGSAWLNVGTTGQGGYAPDWKPFPSEFGPNSGAFVADLDLDSWPDVISTGPGVRSPRWSRNLSDKLASSAELALGPDGEAALVGMGLADVAGDPLPDLILIRDGEAPRIVEAKGNGRHWLALQLGGRWKRSHDHMRTNSEGLGARVTLEGDGLLVRYSHAGSEASGPQSSGPVVLGLGSSDNVPLMHVRWPDGVMQGELALAADVTLPLVEYNRKTGSCPVLFTWNGERFICLGDFLGGGGMGYLVAPGVYSQPDRDEAMAIDGEQLKAVDGAFRISVTEPMDEVAYLDHLMLDVVDRPPGVSTVLDERFAHEGPRPTGELLAYRTVVEPIKVADHAGVDRTETLKRWDRVTADGFRRLRGWVGYAEEHAIRLDFGDRLSRFAKGERLVLALAGWVEYPYSQTNYAAATAGVVLQPPILERRKTDGTWEILDASPGYPAGLPRLMTIDLTGKVEGPSCELRLRTNMECYWDQAFVALVEPDSNLRVNRLPVSRASLGYRGYTREISPDGRLPLIYDYEHVDPAPLAKLKGELTRYGDVADLLTADDDRLCLIGPGDEARIEFSAKDLPAPPAGWTRSYVFRCYGYCKDADPLTFGGDAVEPLPWKGMPSYPFARPARRPLDDAYRTYLKSYQTRAVGRE